MRCNILVADGEALVGTGVTDYLELHGFQVSIVTDGPGAIEVARREVPDLIILELLLPEIDGLEVCRRLRRAGKTATTPIIMISESGDEIDQVVSLEVGADAYLKKPIDHRELLARTRALLRRAGSSCTNGRALEQDIMRSLLSGKSELVAGPLWIDLAGWRVTCRGKEVKLSHREFELLCYFIRHPGTILSREQIRQNAWGGDYRGARVMIDKYVLFLRMKLELDPKTPRLIQTAYGVGFCFTPDG